MEKKKVILDVDTGSDDAVAILCALAAPELDVLGICTVAGNKGLDFTTDNTLRVVDLAKSNVPVYRGCREPMVCTLNKNRHGGFDGHRTRKDENGNEAEYHKDHLDIPAATSTIQPEHAVFYYIDTLMKSEGDITLIPVGPLTNIAMAMRIEPEICKKIKEIVLMGGGCRQTNCSPAAEFNIWIDPEAAKIVMDSGVPVTIVPLDATHKACTTAEEAQEMRSWGTKVGTAVAELVDERILAYRLAQPMENLYSAPIHDALAVCAVIDRSVLKDVVHTHVDIDIGGGLSDGQTVVDPRYYPDEPINCYFAFNADRDKFNKMMMDYLRTYKD